MTDLQQRILKTLDEKMTQTSETGGVAFFCHACGQTVTTPLPAESDSPALSSKKAKQIVRSHFVVIDHAGYQCPALAKLKNGSTEELRTYEAALEIALQ